ncbi:ABC transporter ATP-binding protein [Streptomyces sp. NPDC048445]|uniref:ABC transporter ATP-binding protein n=1 Tax=Streptomyces sp. NPDC048445 TaxID=3365553 RepID=UPI00371DDEF5
MSVSAVDARTTRGSVGEPLLEVSDLVVEFATESGKVRAVDGLSFSVARGETLCVVGESGSGKSATSMAVLGLHDRRSTEISGSIRFDGTDMLNCGSRTLRDLRGGRAAMIFQDPLSALHPHYTVGNQIAEMYRLHNRATRKQARNHAVDMLGRVGIPGPDRRVDDYPHQMSGGMRQRAMIAMALACGPELLIADEPTTALDVTVQAQVLELMLGIQEEMGTAIVLITHDLAVVAETAHHVLVMYAGRAVEQAPVQELFADPSHPYTSGLLQALPRLDGAARELSAIPGQPPAPGGIPPGCSFHPRCAMREEVGAACSTRRPVVRLVGPSHRIACHLGDESGAGAADQEAGGKGRPSAGRAVTAAPQAQEEPHEQH